MKKWMAIILLSLFFYILLRLKEQGKIGRQGILARLNFYVNVLFWLLIALYGGILIRYLWIHFFR
jgi:hypothetical protein